VLVDVALQDEFRAGNAVTRAAVARVTTADTHATIAIVRYSVTRGTV
jgi:hypothetical protein